MKNYINKIKYKINLELGKTPKTKATTADGKFSFYDWGEDYKPENDWFVRFAKHNLLSIDKKLNFYGVYGKGRFVRNKVEGKKIFFSPENLDKKFMKWNILFGDYCLPYVDLGMGFGDIKLAAGIGSFLGYSNFLNLYIFITITFLLGAIISLTLMRLKIKERTSQIAFAPYLAISGFIMMFIQL